MSSAAPRAVRAGAPLLLACLGWVAWLAQAAPPWAWLAPLALLGCSGWGLLRCVSNIDRRFGILGGVLALAPLALGGLLLLGRALALGPDSLPIFLHLGVLLLTLLGLLRRRSFQRWQARQPVHPAPMPLWPARLPLCLLLLALSLGALLWAAPLGRPPADSGHQEQAARAASWLASGDQPLRAGEPQPASELASAAVAALVTAADLPALVASQVLALVALAAVLLLLAESISRLRGNRGGSRAMLAGLLGLNPLAAVLLFSQHEDLRSQGLFTAITPFLDGPALPLALAFTALLLSSTLSTLRRASFHVPRLAGVAAFGLALCAPSAALLILPGWILGIACAHLACRTSPDNDPHPSNTVRRAGEPLTLRAPFWLLAVPVAAGGCAGWLVSGSSLPRLVPAPSTVWTLLLSLGPACLLIFPGIRQLHRSPGREAFFFLGWLLLTLPLALLLQAESLDAELVTRFLAVVLAVPMANGALMLIERHGARARAALAVLVVFLLAAPVLTLKQHQPAERPQAGDSGGAAALRRVAQNAPREAVFVTETGASWLLAATVSRPLLLAGADDTLLKLRSRPGLRARELWAVLPESQARPGFLPVAREGELQILRAAVPDVVLLTVPGLRPDDLQARFLPALTERLGAGLIFEQAISAAPELRAGLSALFSGLSPVERLGATVVAATGPAFAAEPQGLSGLVASYAQAGYRRVAVLAESEERLPAPGWQRVLRGPSAEAATLVDAGLAVLAEAEARPTLLWLHLSDFMPQDGAPVTRSEPERLRSFDRAVQHLLSSLGPQDLFVLTAPLGRARAGRPSGGEPHEPTRSLTEEAIHVPLALLGGGVPAGRQGRLMALQDLPALLLRGELPLRERVLLASPTEPIWGERRQRFKTLLLRSQGPDTALIGRIYDLESDPSELDPELLDEQALGELQAALRLISS
ncbi:MAG: hypothetical protein ACT4PU_03210 [Planctomycetota bacterium]